MTVPHESEEIQVERIDVIGVEVVEETEPEDEEILTEDEGAEGMIYYEEETVVDDCQSVEILSTEPVLQTISSSSKS